MFINLSDYVECCEPDSYKKCSRCNIVLCSLSELLAVLTEGSHLMN